MKIWLKTSLLTRVNVYFFDTLECWRQQGWPHRGLGLGLGLAEGLGLGLAEAMQGNLQGCQCFLTSSPTVEDSAALLSHSKKASGLRVAWLAGLMHHIDKAKQCL